jgi:hypothetical protein
MKWPLRDHRNGHFLFIDHWVQRPFWRDAYFFAIINISLLCMKEVIDIHLIIYTLPSRIVY